MMKFVKFVVIRGRDHAQICIVEDIRDIIAIENTQLYKGVYYVLGGLISPVEGVGPADINLHLLQERAEEGQISRINFCFKCHNRRGYNHVLYS